MKIPFIQLQRSDRESGMGLYIDLTQIESFTPGEKICPKDAISNETIIGMRSGQVWHVRGCISEVMDECFDAMRRISKETNNASLS